MEKSRSFEDLEVWKSGHQFVLFVYKISEKIPKSEMFGLTNQFRRAAVSIAANWQKDTRKLAKLIS
jgi:four helix bundle protein